MVAKRRPVNKKTVKHRGKGKILFYLCLILLIALVVYLNRGTLHSLLWPKETIAGQSNDDAEPGGPDETVDAPDIKEPKEEDDDEEEADEVPEPDEYLILVNKDISLPADYKPEDLTVPNVRFSFAGPHERQQLRAAAAAALEELFAAAEAEGYYLYAVSGFRSYQLQESVYNRHVSTKGREYADKISARPGHSEHQTGLAMDISCQKVGFDLVERFAETEEGKWVAENAHLYGFIIRYPKGAEDITGYNYEPWHLRYVGKEAARYIYENGLVLEEYLEQKSKE